MVKSAPSGRSSEGTTATIEIDSLADSLSTEPQTSPGLVLLYSPCHERYPAACILTGRDLVIGRDPASDLCIPDASVSRQHARIHLRDGRFGLTDLGGRNGTLVDGRFVREIALDHLHEIRVGDAIFKFVEAGAEGYARFRIDGSVVGGQEDQETCRRARAAGIIGGYQIHRLFRAVDAVAKSAIAVMLLGESGTGKEVFARFIHAASGRRGAFQAINCAAIPETLLESELFGYKRGAFSGAARDKPGLVHAADRGTLLLDEIGDMPLAAQAKLLRVLQSKEVVPLGATAPEHVDIRIVCATHQNLMALVRDGRFRGDLYARLNEFRLTLPPLRERKEDIFPLCRALLARQQRPDLELSFAFMLGLLHYDFPFNVRELEGFIKRSVVLSDGSVLDGRHLPDEVREVMKEYGRKDKPAEEPVLGPAARTTTGGVPTEAELRALLAREKGNISGLSRALGKDRTQIHRWIRRYRIDLGEYR